MRNFRVYFLLCFGVYSASYAGDTDPVAELKKGQPEQVASLIDRIIGCNHWLGEPPYNADRAKEIDKVVSELRCGQLETDESAVLGKYGARPKAKEAIDAAKQIFL